MALLGCERPASASSRLPETLFDMDYPGHYLRRIKTVGLTIPCVVGPYASINCTLTMLSNSVRRAAGPSSPYTRNEEGDDDRFADNLGAIRSIATSGGQSDSGLFELNFRDERYLPFEGAGAISRWRIELPIETNRFDRNTISDVIIHLRYTAREGGERLGPRPSLRNLAGRGSLASDMNSPPSGTAFCIPNRTWSRRLRSGVWMSGSRSVDPAPQLQSTG